MPTQEEMDAYSEKYLQPTVNDIIKLCRERHLTGSECFLACSSITRQFLEEALEYSDDAKPFVEAVVTMLQKIGNQMASEALLKRLEGM